MKKSSLVGIEVYYEEKPVAKLPAAPPWKYGDLTDEDIEENFDFSGRCEAVTKEVDEDIEEYAEEYVEEITLAFEQVHGPVAGKIYKVRDLGLCAKYVGDVYTPLSGGKIRTMKYHGATFYIDGQNMLFASKEEVDNYLEESDYNTT
jgi:hypothetical protein